MSKRESDTAEGKCNRENEKKGVNVGQQGGGRQGKKERREERKEVGEGELDQWKRKRLAEDQR